MHSTHRYSGSNLGSVLSASAFAVASTLPVPPAREFPPVEVVRADDDGYSTVSLVDNFTSEDATDHGFVLNRPVSKASANWFVPTLKRGGAYHMSGMDSAHSMQAFARTHWSPKSGIELHYALGAVPHSLSVKRAQEFYGELPSKLRSPLTEELIAVFFFGSGQAPKIEHIDDMTTLDVSSANRSVSVLIEDKLCAISSFSKHKELKATFAIESREVFDDFKDLVLAELAGLNV